MESTIKHTASVINPHFDKTLAYEDLLDIVENRIKSSGTNVDLPLTHTFSKGLYSREMFVPEGAVLTSKVHKEAHQFMLIKGSMIIISEGGAVRITAPFHGITEKGSTRLGIALEDSIWTTFHNCNLVEDKDYSEDEARELVLEIEDMLVEDRHNINLLKQTP